MTSVKRNIIANFLGSAWSALMGLAFVPLYIHYLGMEAYGLIGVFVLLQAWMALLDMGLTPTFSREMARFKAARHTPQSIRDLVRSFELVYALIAAAIAVTVMLGAPLLATRWLMVEQLPTATVTDALSITGGVIAVRWLAGLYRGAIIGLQRQVWLNICIAIFSTLRGLGVIVVLAWVSPTIQAFFVYQGLLFGLEAIALGLQMRRLLPTPPHPARFRWHSLRQVWRFAAGMTTIAILATLLTQVDKLLLSKLLPLTDFGYYTLAGTVAGALYLMVMPIVNVVRPRLTELVARGDTGKLTESYHQFSQMLALTLVPVALVLSVFSDHVLLLWTRNLDTTAAVAPLVSLLVLGTTMNGLMNIPYALQLAYGKTRFAIWSNAIAVVVLVPSVYMGVSIYGAIAAASIWVLLNLGYVTIALPVMHRTLLPGEKWRWYGHDVLAPTISALIPVAIIYFFSTAPSLQRPLASIGILVLAILTAAISAALATSFGRSQLHQLMLLIPQRHSSSLPEL